MPRTGLNHDEIRARAVELTMARMRRMGVDKVRLSHVANDLKVSHAALYAHFADKAALLDAVTERWLAEDRVALAAICASGEHPVRKIESWFLTRYRRKRARALDRAPLLLEILTTMLSASPRMGIEPGAGAAAVLRP